MTVGIPDEYPFPDQNKVLTSFYNGYMMMLAYIGSESMQQIAAENPYGSITTSETNG